MELQQQIFDYSEATVDPRCSPQNSRQPDFSQAVASMTPYSPHVLYYPPPPPLPEAAYGLPHPQLPQPQAEPYYYYFPAAGHSNRQSPDTLSSKLSTPPAGLSMPPPPPMCYGPYTPCCCCAQLHYQRQHLQPRCSPDHLLFPQQQLPAASVSEFIPPLVPTLQTPPMPLPPSLPQQPVAPMRRAARAAAEQGSRLVRGGDSATRRRPSGLTEPPVSGSGSWILHDLQQRRRNGYMHNILYKTELCRDMQDSGTCPRGRACQFAHSAVELQDPRRHPLYKTAFCYDYKNKGHCPRGERCFHVHEIAELRESSGQRTHLASPSSNGSGSGPARAGGSGGRSGTSRQRRSPAAGGVSQKPHNSLEPGRRAGKDAKLATTETSYRYLMKKLSSSSSKCSPSSAGRRGSAVGSGTDAGPPEPDLLASLEAKTRRLGLGPDDGEERILDCAQ